MLSQTNKYLVPRPPLDPESLDFLPCQCTSDSPCNEDSTCVNRAIHIECNPKSCPVGELCQNQRMQKFQNAKTELVFTGNRGWGLKASTDLSVGDFVIEYVGEILDEAMCRERLKKAHTQNNNNFYMLTLEAGLIIDAGRKSNHARFINHSCGPNCETQKWRVRGEPRIGIFARQNIPAGSELTFDYHLDSLGNEKKKCFCGSKNCSGFLGLRSIKVASEDEIKAKLKVKKKKKAKPRPSAKKEEEDAIMQQREEDRHDDECFICKDGGELLLCDRKSCCRAYHLVCINRKVFPSKSKKWDCPWHFCSKCQKPALAFCSACPVSYCSKHLQDNLSKRPDGSDLFCRVCVELDVKRKEVEAGLDSVPQDVAMKEEGAKPLDMASLLLRKKSPQAAEGGKWTARPQSSESVSVVSPTKLLPPERGSAESALSPPTSKGRFRSPLSPADDSEQSVISRQSSGKKESSSRRGSRKSPADSSRLRSPSVDPVRIGTNSSEQWKHQDGAQQNASVLRGTDARLATTIGLSSPSRILQNVNSVQPMVVTTTTTATTTTPHIMPRAPNPPLAASSDATALRTSLNRAPLFQPQSPTFGQNYTVPVPESAKLPENYVDFGVTRAAACFQQPQQQSPVCNSFINPVWFMPRNSLDATGAMGAGGFHSYPTYPSALLNHGTLGFPYPTAGYFGDPLANATAATAAAANLDSFSHHQHHHPLSDSGGGGRGRHHRLSTSSTIPSSHLNTAAAAAAAAASFQPVSAATATFQPTTASFPATVFPQTHSQNGFLPWKYC